ncbi:class I SAM-dependent methyltransferase [Mycobacterium asiaticum]|uniref:class I SAM-dependent methyltransferase n=1 Tax=Mycobacterium asiaticum TaxID=1790 RepID=UPI00055AD25C|nr:class I SAM-dependent methyltransferase [Mycobacterium asiaticum]ORA10332.1 ubiquinone biosynthesis methyltransferase UbiE [Mycobacterium asiaticum DSM 44297]
MKKSGLARSDVPEAFDVGADAYDQLVGANPGYHANLRLSVSRMDLPDRGRGLRLLDAGCGTGASTAALVQAAPEAEIVAVDAAAGMLHAAQAKSWPESVRFVHTRIEDLHEHGITGPFDGILAAYLLRNLANPDAQLRTFTTLLRPGATLAVHEYSVRDSPVAQRIWHGVCWGIIIPAGWWRTRSTTLYRHLWRSVLSFDGAARFRQRMIDAGFTDVRSETVPGWERNIVHTFIGRAPEAPVGPEGKASP